MNLNFEAYLNSADSLPMHLTCKPYLEKDTIRLGKLAQTNSSWNKKQFAYLFADYTWIKRKLKYESFLGARGNAYEFEVNPVFVFEYGRDVGRDDSKQMYKNFRGFQVNAHLTDRVSFTTSFYECQAFIQTYLASYVNNAGVERFANGTYKKDPGFGSFFGMGRTKPFKTTGFDFAQATGVVSVKATKNLFIEFGHDKNFIGDGYRSMLLSDNAHNYPFAKFIHYYLKQKLQVNTIYAQLSSLRRLPAKTTPEATFETKLAVFNYLSYIVNKNLQIGFFEATIWQRFSNSIQQNIHPLYFNPIPLVSILRFGLNNANNVLIGTTARYKVNKSIVTYAQLALDDISKGKFGSQLGVKWFNFLNSKNWHFQAEWNYASPLTYNHAIALQNFSHFNMPLAHTWGGGFNEINTFFNWRNTDWFAEIRTSYGNYKLYNNDEWGKSLLVDYAKKYNNPTIDFTQILYADLKLGYLINPITNMRLFVGFTNHFIFKDVNFNSNYIYLSLSTALINTYFDI